MPSRPLPQAAIRCGLQATGMPEHGATAYAAVRAQSDPAARAALLDAAWRGRAAPSASWSPRCSRSRSSELPVERQLAGVAPSVARALLAAERPVPAVGWLSLLTADAGTGSR